MVIKGLYSEFKASVSYVRWAISEYKVEIALVLLLALQLAIWF